MLEKTFNPQDIEARLYKTWEEAGAFRAGRRPRAKPFAIVIPPPNVTGSLHMGHALNNTIQDILVRFERMRGKDVLWQPGTDHAGIATQMVVERLLAEENRTDRRTMGREAFVSADMGVEGTFRRADQPAAEAARRLVRLEPRTFHHGRRAVARRHQGVRAAASGRAHLQGQAPGQLGPEIPHRHIRPRSAAGGDQGHAVVLRLSAGGRSGAQAHHRDDATRDHARRHGGGGQSQGRALCRARGQAGDAAAGRATHPDRRRRIFGSREGNRRGEDHARPRLQRLRGRPAP